MNKNPEIGQQVNVDGINVNYHDQGAGPGHSILLLHGSGPGVSAWVNWKLAVPVLANNHRVLAPDIPGFGYTDRPEHWNYTMEEWLSWVVGFLDTLNLDKVSVVGNSFGSALALGLAIHHPERLDRMVLMGAAGIDFELTEGLDKVWGYEPSFDNMKELMELFAYNQDAINDDLVEARYQASIRPGYQESFSAMFPPPRQSGIAKLAHPPESIAAISHEALILHGRDDKVVPVQNGITLNQLIPRSELHIFGCCGHWVQIEKTESFTRLLLDFFAD